MWEVKLQLQVSVGEVYRVAWACIPHVSPRSMRSQSTSHGPVPTTSPSPAHTRAALQTPNHVHTQGNMAFKHASMCTQELTGVPVEHQEVMLAGIGRMVMLDRRWAHVVHVCKALGEAPLSACSPGHESAWEGSAPSALHRALHTAHAGFGPWWRRVVGWGPAGKEGCLSQRSKTTCLDHPLQEQHRA